MVSFLLTCSAARKDDPAYEPGRQEEIKVRSYYTKDTRLNRSLPPLTRHLIPVRPRPNLCAALGSSSLTFIAT
jgi:hypothetical protein